MEHHMHTVGQSQATMILKSISPDNIALRTLQLRYPRIIHAEFMTHREFSRNARSSRAVPATVMLSEVESAPFIPDHWSQNQPGMQAANEDHNEAIMLPFYPNTGQPSVDGERFSHTREEAWLLARNFSSLIAKAFADAGYHKQIFNRVVEPYSYIDTLFSTTSLANFNHLRRDKAAEPHMRDLAEAIYIADNESPVQSLSYDQWHLPFISPSDYKNIDQFTPENYERMIEARDNSRVPGSVYNYIALACSVDRCKRISYKPFTTAKEISEEVKGHDALISANPVHATPTEHQALPDIRFIKHHNNPGSEWGHHNQHGNLVGWRQYRKMIPNEYIHEHN
jgi:hypothetical protein